MIPRRPSPRAAPGHCLWPALCPTLSPGGGHKAGFSRCRLARSESQPSPESVFLSLKIRETRLARAEARWPWRVLWSSAEGASLLLPAFTTCCGPPRGACHTRGERRAESQLSGGLRRASWESWALAGRRWRDGVRQMRSRDGQPGGATGRALRLCRPARRPRTARRLST